MVGENKGKKGGKQRREVRFDVFTDSHGRELGNLLRGADVNVKGGARMENIIEGVKKGGHVQWLWEGLMTQQRRE